MRSREKIRDASVSARGVWGWVGEVAVERQLHQGFEGWSFYHSVCVNYSAGIVDEVV